MHRLRTIAARNRGWIALAVVAAMLTLALVALDRLTSEVRLADVKAALAMLSPMRIALALGFTAFSYLSLTYYDVLALHVIGRKLPWRTAATASFTSYTLSHNMGVALLTGGSARYRVYTAAGLEGPDVARIIGLTGATFWAGVAAVASVALLGHPGPLTLPGIVLTAGQAHLAGGAMLAGVAGVFVATRFVRAPVRLPGFTVPLPRPGHFAAQLVVAGLDLSCASAALFVLIPDAAPALLPAFVLAYALGIIAAAVTHVPGGIGVFEAVVLGVLPGDRATLLAALVAYRVVYYLLPLAAGIAVLAIHEGRHQRGTARFLTGLDDVFAAIAPLVLSVAVFAGGALLLLSGALPSVHARIGDLGAILPLPFIEASHLAASLVGTLLLLLAPGLYRRLDGANLWARVLLVAGALFSLAKGIDYEEAVVCLAVAALLQWTRAAFYRRTALTQALLSPGWLAGIVTVSGVTLWTGFFAFRHIPYSDDLWWHFALYGDAPRFLRAGMASAAAVGGVAVWRLLAPSTVPVAGEAPDPAGLDAALAHAENTDALLAVTGDKRFLWSEAGDAFVMYAISGATWAVMGDPVGPRVAWPDLLWRLREAADRAQARLLLYEVSGAVLDVAIGMGLAIVKIGEAALVDLDRFDLETPRLRGPRRTARSLERKGLRFRIVPAAAMPTVIDDLERISAEWMLAKGQREKRFSLGRFDRDYLARFDTALVYLEGRIVAFANLWTTPDGREASVDLMRHADAAPSGTMDFLFVELILWARAHGYRRFSLGMAPLSGIEDRRLAPAWARLASFAFHHGERLYGFQGLRAYKEKFAPEWVPRYVAGPNGVGMLLALRDVARLIDGKQDARAARPRTGAAPGRALAPAPAADGSCSAAGRSPPSRASFCRRASSGAMTIRVVPTILDRLRRPT